MTDPAAAASSSSRWKRRGLAPPVRSRPCHRLVDPLRPVVADLRHHEHGGGEHADCQRTEDLDQSAALLPVQVELQLLERCLRLGEIRVGLARIGEVLASQGEQPRADAPESSSYCLRRT
jgi:hypothetical protein